MGYLTATLRTDTLRGNVGRGITVDTNDPTTPRIRLTVRAVIAGSVVIYPGENLTFNNVTSRQNRTRLLVRRDPTETGELKVGDIKPSADWFAVKATRLEEPTPAGGGLPAGQPGDWLLEAELVGTAPHGVTRETLTFSTGLTRQAEVTLPVLGNLRPPVNLTSELIELAPAEGQGLSATVLFSVRRGLDPAELRIEAQPKALEVELEQAGARFYKAHVNWDGGEFGGGSILFSLGQERYSVPVKAAAPKPAGG